MENTLEQIETAGVNFDSCRTLQNVQVDMYDMEYDKERCSLTGPLDWDDIIPSPA